MAGRSPDGQYKRPRGQEQRSQPAAAERSGGGCGSACSIRKSGPNPTGNFAPGLWFEHPLRGPVIARAESARAGRPQAAAPVTPAAPLLRRPTATAPAATASPSQAADQWDDLFGPGTEPRPIVATKTAKSRKAAAAKRSATSRMIAVGAAVGLALLVVVGFVVYSQMNPAAATLVFDWPGVERSEVSASVDGTAIPVPPRGLGNMPARRASIMSSPSGRDTS